jgi:NTP pyrophosphatase (non-canonical NTP hydrolase)
MQGEIMKLTEYQAKARATAIYKPEHRITYPTLGAVNEAGEVAGKVKKMLRGDGVSLEAIADEIGDVLWYLAALAGDIGYDLDTIAKRNLEKLDSRKERGVLQGDGDNR